MELTFELAEKFLAAQPFSVLLGARLTAFGAGGATLELDVRDDLKQQNGYLHGGVLGYAADNAITFAAGTALGPEVLTGGFTISYLRPGQGAVLRAEAKVVARGQPAGDLHVRVVDDRRRRRPPRCAPSRRAL